VSTCEYSTFDSSLYIRGLDFSYAHCSIVTKFNDICGDHGSFLTCDLSSGDYILFVITDDDPGNFTLEISSNFCKRSGCSA